MKVNYVLLSRCLAICLLPLSVAGCNKPTQTGAAAKSVEAQVSQAASTLPVVTLTGAKVLEDPASPTVQVRITADGPFGSNVILKSDPERIIVIMHNAKIGEAPEKVEVNDGTISRIEIAQLESGKGPAARVTVGLMAKTQYRVVPGDGALGLEIKKVDGK